MLLSKILRVSYNSRPEAINNADLFGCFHCGMTLDLGFNCNKTAVLSFMVSLLLPQEIIFIDSSDIGGA